MKIAFIIAGFNMNQSAKDAKYKDLRSMVAQKGYKVVAVPFQWNNKTVSDYLSEFISFYEKHKSKDDKNIIIGNSYGAIVAFLAAPIVKPDKVLACSLSAYFKEDMYKQKPAYMLRRFGKRRTADSHVISADKTAEEINKTKVAVVFMRGEKENWGRFIKLGERIEQSAKAVKNSKIVIVSNSGHSFRDPAYVQAIVSEI